MNAKNIPTVQADFLDKINLNVNFVVWAGVGTGSLATVINHFDKPEYHVQRVIMPRVDHETFMVLPVLGENQKISHYLSDEMKALKKAQESKKLVFVFDDLSSSTVAGSRAFYDAVVNRKFGGIELNDSDIVLALGSVDSDGTLLTGVIPTPLMNHLAHYVLEREQVAA
jgi:hypothetical protein